MVSARRLTWDDFGPTLQRMRWRRHLTQERFAQTLGCGRIHICRLESRQRYPSRLLLRAVAHLPDLSSDEQSLIDAFEQMREFRFAQVQL